MTNRSFLVLACALGIAAAAPSQLTVIKLKSGEAVEGYVVQETKSWLKIETIDGRTVRYNHADIASMEETSRTGFPELDKKLEEIDRNDAGALAELADWAKGQKIRAWQVLAREALEKDPQHEKANTLLGHTKVGDRWYTSKSEADRAEKAAFEAEMKEKGYLKVAGGWISREDKPLFDKDRSAFEKDERDVWRDKAAVMREKGLVLVKGKWMRAASAADQAEMDEFKKAVGEEVLILQFEHFKLAMMNTPAEKIEEYGELAESIYAWFLKEMGKPADHPLWPRKATFWVIKDKKMRDVWMKAWRSRFGFNDRTFEWLLEGTNFYTDLTGVIVLEATEDIRNTFLHGIGHFTISHFSRGLQGTPPWLEEAWGNYIEHVKLGSGHVACSTNSKYGGEGGKADKGKFSTKDAKDRCRGILREGIAEPMINLSKLDLNSLNGDHLAKGWSVVEWLMSTRKEQFIAWLEGMNQAQQEEALGAAIPGWDFAKLDEEWEAYVKSKY
jgi:hypothetical protein